MKPLCTVTGALPSKPAPPPVKAETGPSAAWLSASAWLGWSKRPCSRDEPPSSLRLADEESGVKRWWLLERTAALKPGSFSKVYPSHLHSSICEGNLIATPDLTLDRMRRAAWYACCNISQSKERVRVCSLSRNFFYFYWIFNKMCTTVFMSMAESCSE